MTILAILALLLGIFLVSDGAFDRGLLARVFPGAMSAIRITEVGTGGIIFLVLGFVLSPC